MGISPLRILVRLLAVFACALGLQAQVHGRLPWRSFGFADGLTSLSVLTLAQNAKGLIFAGTEAGLFRFDGRTFEGLPLPLDNRFITALRPDADGRLWVGTRNGLGLLGEDGRTFSLVPGLPARRIEYLGRDAGGVLWVLVDGHVWAGRDGAAFRELPGPGGAVPLGLCAAPGNLGVLALTSAGLLALKAPEAAWVPRILPAACGRPLAAGVDGEGWLWVRSAVGCFRQAPGGRWERLQGPLAGSVPDHLKLTPDREGWLWINAVEGIFRCRGRRVQAMDAVPRGQVPITALVDREGSTWLAAVGVVQVLGRGAWTIEGQPEGLPSDVVWTTARDATGRLWAATDGGLAVKVDGVWRTVRKGQFSRVRLHPDGSMVAVGSPGGTLYRVDPRTLQVEAVVADCLPPTPVSRGLGVDRDGGVYLSDFHGGAARGLRRGGRWTWEPVQVGGHSPEDNFEVVQDSRGAVFLPTRSGVWLRENGAWASLGETLPFNPLAATRCTDGDVWVAYLDQAVLTRHRREGGTWKRIDTWRPFPGKPTLVVFALESTPEGRLWTGTSQGLGLLDPANHRTAAWFAPGEGIPGADATTQGLTLEPDGTLWYGTTEGTGRFRGAGTEPLPPLAGPVLLDWNARAGPGASGAELSPGAILDAHFGAPTACSPGTTTMEARLAGVDPNWVRLDGFRVRYPSLAHGSYRLDVRLLRDGTPGPVLSLAVRVLPHPWETWWARLLALAGAGLGVYGLIVLRYRALRRHNAELQDMVAARTIELQSANLELARASRAKSMFLASMSHELRTPLNAILLYSELLGDDARERGDGEASRDLTRIQASGRHLLSMINSVLDLAKIEAGMMACTFEEVAIGPLLNEVADTLAPLAGVRGNQVRLSLAGEFSFRTDLTKVRQVLINLGGNACKFTEGGSVTLEAAREGADLVLQVADTGKGMCPQEVQRVFEAFEQGSEEIARTHGGTGLGLTISRHLVRLLGGTIQVESEPGLGSRFRVRIPESIPSATPDHQQG